MMHLMHRVVKRRRTCSVALALAVTASLMMLVAGANAATIVVKNTTELEKAVTTANGNTEANTIELTAGTYLPLKTMVFTNTHGTQTLAGPVGKIGEATPGAKISGASVTPTPPTEQELLTVSAGVSLAVKHVVVTGGGSASNSAIEDLGSLNVENSTIDGNTGTQINVHGGATASLTNSTLADGLELGMADEGEASFLNVTVVHNASDGIGGTGSGKLSLTNTIVALNEGSAQCGSFSTLTNDHSLASDASCGGEAAFQKKTPLLQTSLLNDGGSTTIYSEKAGSPTIDAGDSAKCPATDQRGYPRPDVTSTACDIGADEYSPTKPTIVVPAEIVAPSTGTGAVVNYSVEATDPDALVKSLSCLPASGSTFANGTTVVKCNAVDGHENTAEASFNVRVATAKHHLEVTVTGKGTVTSAPAGINCGNGHTECNFEFIEGEAVKLTSTPEAGSSLAGWGGACSGTGSCSVTMGATNKSVTAEFSGGPVNTGLPVISGQPYNGQTLKTTNGTWNGAISYTYQWEDCNSSGESCTNIAGATEVEYTLTSADIEHTIRVAVIASNSSGSSLPAASAATAVVTASVVPTVEGKVPFKQTLESLCTQVPLGSFLTGHAAIVREAGPEKGPYTGTCLLTATSTSEASRLVAEDTEVGTNKGHLVQPWKAKTYALVAPLEVKATDAESLGTSGTGGIVAPLTSQQTLLNFPTPINNDGVTATFSQAIGTKEKLHTGTYSKVITLTLSTTTP